VRTREGSQELAVLVAQDGTKHYVRLRKGAQSIVYEGKTYVRSSEPGPNGMVRFVE
jgi:hypothetical protein